VKAGKVEYRVEKAGIVHVPIGKASFGPEKLDRERDGARSGARSRQAARRKGNYLRSMSVATTMGPAS
jgi:large subunit ribosomal protein L1